MSRITDAFKDKRVFIPFITGGDPDIETTEKLVRVLAKAGAGVIEIGIPFSDPVAEGEVIQAADERALKAGCTVDKLFSMVTRLREDVTTPLLFMTYYNAIFGYGTERFIEKCVQCGIDGLIVPDLPFEEMGELLAPAHEGGIEVISLIAPTSDERIDTIARQSEGFLYCVSSLGVTGVRGQLGGLAKHMVERAKRVTATPCAVGFGVSNAEQAAEIAKFADGVIVGSAIVRLVAEYKTASEQPVFDFAKGIVEAIS
ncbi:MAG: tryptophan synthase subunit alpha [Oscillospiraceae bacterium]|nr:tryptophan synthase subunit alpha [Oscillospiraceae bacterium]